jgi:hypothetical protein
LRYNTLATAADPVPGDADRPMSRLKLPVASICDSARYFQLNPTSALNDGLELSSA